MKPLILVLVLALTGCSVARDLAKDYESAERFAKGVDQYCLNVPLAEREKNRQAVNELTVVGDIEVTCQGDPD